MHLSGVQWFMVFLIAVFLFLVLDMLLEPSTEPVAKRLQSLLGTGSGRSHPVGKEERKRQKSLFKRVHLMAETRLSVYIDKRVRKGQFAPLELKLLQASAASTTSQHWANKVIWACAGLLIGIFAKDMRLSVALAGLGFYYPDYKLKEKIQKRQYQIKRELPDFLDLLAATAPSAKNLEDAIRRVCDRSDEGEVPKEFRITLDEINAGRRQRDALNDFSKRCGIAEIKTLVSQINQSQVFGTSVEATLQIQAEKIRKLKKVLAEIKARKASVTLLLPSMFLLLTIMIIIAGPSIVQLIGAFGQMNK